MMNKPPIALKESIKSVVNYVFLISPSKHEYSEESDVIGNVNMYKYRKLISVSFYRGVISLSELFDPSSLLL